MNKKQYKLFLLSDKWLNFRKEVLSIFNNECWFCKSKKCLQVHHLRYTKKTLLNTTKLAKNNLRWFMLLCKNCHEEVHTFKRETGLELYRATQEYRRLNFPKSKRWITKNLIKQRLELLKQG